ncbi:Protein of unknown function [Lentibacillus halodurans]|uniref:DUF2642 domain-containing protein n=1 Tax=Lentibacillus halodurans TaxID=237679 RepID=A0A1I0XXA8_9BACI|nr:DUF2642 domain-containing protein [Lentibacillus halodurans]SFB05789.1 Protein of unknown function [Lentibacillus halodurans]
MANLTNRQRNLLQLANQLSQNLVDVNNTNTNTNTNSSLNNNVSIDLPGFDLNAGLNLGLGRGNGTDTPTTLREVLMELVNEQVEVTTPFGPVSGTLIAVRDDYIVLIETNGNQVLVRIENIELVSEL